MIFGILTLITALAISAVAIYYSVAGLVAIFAAAAIPILIMGTTLEIAKLVTAVWLHKYWDRAAWWLKTYLSISVVVLMFITSMGIFGFLSKAHIEQTSASEESIARVETIQKELDRQDVLVARAEDRIVQLEDTDSGVDAGIQQQIDTEQTRIDSAYTRIQPAIAEQNVIIANVTALFQSELDKIDAELDKLQSYIDAGDIPKAQGMIGAKADGAYGPKTAQAFTDFQDAKKVDRGEWIQKLQDAAQSPTVIAARAEITRLRSRAEQQIANSNTLINRLRTQLGNTTTADTVQGDIDAQQARIATAATLIDGLTEEKIQLEAEYRKLEAEVGPIKYIAEFVYGEAADKNMLEEAVKWVIIVIIFVFDPLAVLLLLAAQYTFEFRRKELEDDDGERLRLEQAEYERARAQAIVDNVPPDIATPTPPAEEEKEQVNEQSDTIDDGQLPGAGDTTEGTGEDNKGEAAWFDRGAVEDANGNDAARAYTIGRDDAGRVESTEQDYGIDNLENWNEWVEKANAEAEANPEVFADDFGDIATLEKQVLATPVINLNADMLPPKAIPDTANRIFYPEELEETKKKLASELPEESNPNSRYYEDREQDDEWVTARADWEASNPKEEREAWKDAFSKGEIDSLPWETLVQPDNYNSNSEGYQQNAEQSESTLFNKLSKK
jgi:peptidoglycan hydrolase-like protein with peptidoglycan-binding domain